MTEFGFDLVSGTLLVGEDAVALHREQSGSEVAPLDELLVGDNFPFQLGDFDQPPRTIWSKDELVELGHWLLNVTDNLLGNSPAAWRLTTKHLERLHILGLGPSEQPYRHSFGKLSNFRENLGIRPGKIFNKYADWTIEDYRRYAAMIQTRTQGKPSEQDYMTAGEEGDGPSMIVLRRHMGGVRELNALIGYPDFRLWDKKNYITWGVKAMQANDGAVLSRRTTRILSKRGRGPSDRGIYKHFDSLVDFQTEVEIAWQQTVEEEALVHAAHLMSFKEIQGSHSNLLAKDEYTQIEQVVIGAKYMLAQECLGWRSEEVHARVALCDTKRLVEEIRRFRPALSPGFIEVLGANLGIKEIIWPSDNYLEYLRVTPLINNERHERNLV